MRKNHSFATLLTCLMLVALTSCASLGQTAPPVNDTYSVVVKSDPDQPRIGANDLTLTITDKRGALVEGAEVRVSAGMPGMGHGGANGRATDKGKGNYTLRVPLMMAGEWLLRIEIVKTGSPNGINEIVLKAK